MNKKTFKFNFASYASTVGSFMIDDKICFVQDKNSPGNVPNIDEFLLIKLDFPISETKENFNRFLDEMEKHGVTHFENKELIYEMKDNYECCDDFKKPHPLEWVPSQFDNLLENGISLSDYRLFCNHWMFTVYH